MGEKHLNEEERWADKAAVDAAAGLHECICGRMTHNVIASEEEPVAACCPACAGGREVCSREEHNRQRWAE